MQPAITAQPDACRNSAKSETPALPEGVFVRPLTVHVDDRGHVAEIFRREWIAGAEPLQWAMLVSDAGVIRGMHVHLRHDDYLVVLDGHVALGLHDVRPGSPTHGHAAMLDVSSATLAAVVIPHGVAHGLLFHARTTFVLGTTHYYDTADELGCHWRDPDLGLAWPVTEARLSPRDDALPSLRELARRIPPWRAA